MTLACPDCGATLAFQPLRNSTFVCQCPRHPLYLPKNAPLVPWPAGGGA